MEIETKEFSKILVVKPLSKRLDVFSSADFKVKMISYIENGHRYFILNLSFVNFIDSSGLGALIAFFKQLKSHFGMLTMFGVNELVMNLFKLTGMDQEWKVYKDEAEATQAIKDEIKKRSGVS